MSIIATPLGWIMSWMYEIIQNYGIVLILFTFLIRLLLFPLNIKQQKGTAKMSLLQPKMDKLQKKYGKDKIIATVLPDRMERYFSTGLL